MEITTVPLMDHPTGKQSMSMFDFLCCLVGGGLMFAYFKFGVLLNGWSELSRLLFLMAMGLLIVYGGRRLMFGAGSKTAAPGKLRVNRNRVMLPREGAVYLLIMSVLFIGSLLGRSNMLMLVFALMAGPFVLNGWITFSLLKKTSLRRSVPAAVIAGEPVTVEINLTNRKRWLALWVMVVRDQIQATHERLDASVLFSRVSAGQNKAAHYRMRLMRRGRYTLGPLQLATRFPLGLVERGLMFDVSDEILVYPRIGRLTSKWRSEQLISTELVQRQEPRRGVHDDEFHRIREFRWGDNPRAIHWKTSARRQELMVREFRESRDDDLIVILDLQSPKQPMQHDLERVELAVSFAATVCIDHAIHGRGSRICLLCAKSEPVRCESRGGMAGVGPILGTLAVVEAANAPDIRQMLEGWQRERSTRTKTVLVTTRRRSDRLFASLEKSMVGIAGEIRVVVADPPELDPYFEFA